MLGSGFDVYFGFVCGVFGYLKIVKGDGAVVVEAFGAIELSVGKSFVGDGFAIVRVGSGDVRALHAEEELAFLYCVAEAGANFDYAAGGDGDYGNSAGYIGADCAGDDELRCGFVFGGGG
jgi:hypothetical protein